MTEAQDTFNQSGVTIFDPFLDVVCEWKPLATAGMKGICKAPNQITWYDWIPEIPFCFESP
jgi:hypothetical protein